MRRSAWSASTGANPTRRSSATGSASSIGARASAPRPRAPSIDFFFEEFDAEQLCAGARVANPASRNVLEKCGFQWSGVELHRFEALGSSTPVDSFRLSRSVWSSLKNWGEFDAARACRPAHRPRPCEVAHCDRVNPRTLSCDTCRTSRIASSFVPQGRMRLTPAD